MTKFGGTGLEDPDEAGVGRRRSLEGECEDDDGAAEGTAIDAKFLYQYGLRPKSLHKCIWAKPHHPKNLVGRVFAGEPGLVRMTNMVLLVSR